MCSHDPRFDLPLDLARALPLPDRLALFLDVDGTLIGSTHCDRVAGIPAPHLALLERIGELTSGAVAILTGRTVEMVDDMFAPLILSVGGLQGADRRFADGRRAAPVLSERERSMLDPLEEEISTSFPGLTVERKPAGLSVVYDEDAGTAERIEAIAVRHVGTTFDTGGEFIPQWSCDFLKGCEPRAAGRSGWNAVHPVCDPHQVDGGGADDVLQVGFGKPDVATAS
jgi:trehalose-6-phosphatase